MPSPSPYTCFAFETLYCKLENDPNSVSFGAYKRYFKQNREFTEKYPLFVTWNIEDDSEYQLRGCIGTFSPLPLDSGIQEYALIAALDDPRFQPILKTELPYLSCNITLLKDFEKVDDIMDWQIGVHGIRIKFHYNNKARSATFLPDVAVEQGWDKETTLKYLIVKAGGPKSLDSIKSLDISLTRYEGEKSSMTYAEFMETRKNVK